MSIETTTTITTLKQQRIQRQLVIAPARALAGNRDLEHTVVVHPA